MHNLILMEDDIAAIGYVDNRSSCSIGGLEIKQQNRGEGQNKMFLI